jgi:hypothetical protein
MRLMTAVLIDEHVHEKVFNNRIAELLHRYLWTGPYVAHLHHISFYFYQRGTGPKYGSGVPCLPLKKSLGVGVR